MNRINGTRFLKQDELAQQLVEIDLNQEQYPVGGVPLLVKDGKAYVDGSDSHTIVFGATGSKKTRMFAMPSIGIFARAGESFVVTDPKGELYRKTAGEVEACGYQVRCLNLRQLRQGDTWNPLALPYEYYHRGKKAKALEMVNELATMIIGQDSTEESFWTNSSISILVGFILLLFEKATREECHLKSLVELWNKYLENRKKFFEAVKENYKNTMVYQKLSSLDNPSDKTVGSLEAFLVMGFNKLTINEELVCFLSQQGMDLKQLTDRKTAVYLIVPDENKSYHFIVSLFLEQFYEVMIQAAQNRPDNQLPVRMNFLIDEFANIPRLENMEAMITAARSRNIRFHLIIQSMKQLEQKYEENAAVICSNCNNWVFLYSKEYELLQEISRLCGEVIYDNNMRLPLFSEFDLQHLSKERGEALVLAGRNFPCISNLADINEYPYKERVPEQDGVSACESRQEWMPVSVCQFTEKRKSQYALPLTSMVMWECEEFKQGENRRLLVAVGPEGMIVSHKIVDAPDIADGIAQMGMMYDIRYRMKLEVRRLHWYSADVLLEEKYRVMLERHPEMVYLTLDELGKKHFRKEKGLHEEYPFEVRKGEAYIARGKACGRRRNENVFASNKNELEINMRIKSYGGMIGEYYALNVFFRKANKHLAGTRFEELPWVQYWDEFSLDEFPTFQKRRNPDDYMSIDFRLEKS